MYFEPEETIQNYTRRIKTSNLNYFSSDTANYDSSDISLKLSGSVVEAAKRFPTSRGTWQELVNTRQFLEDVLPDQAVT